jgi:hypothetical protein
MILKNDIQPVNEEPKSEFGFKHWLIRTVFVTVMLILLAYIIEIYIHLTLIREVIIGIAVVLAIGFVHEILHYREAIKMGYKPTWYRTRFTMGFEVDHIGTLEKKQAEIKKISRAPYIILVPVSFMILGIGIWFWSLGLIMASVGSLVFHSASYYKEGKQ